MRSFCGEPAWQHTLQLPLREMLCTVGSIAANSLGTLLGALKTCEGNPSRISIPRGDMIISSHLRLRENSLVPELPRDALVGQAPQRRHLPQIQQLAELALVYLYICTCTSSPWGCSLYPSLSKRRASPNFSQASIAHLPHSSADLSTERQRLLL